jgi:prepilin-type N-terminal cleavage/methylation domain-containing protein
MPLKVEKIFGGIMLHTLSSRNQKQAGFTLVELAIVLVIIGLIVGGVLVGQDLIKSAEIRATISQMEKYNAGATTFRDKFGGMPGDLVAAKATQFALAVPNLRTGLDGVADGDGVIENGTGATAADFGNETRAFWSDLAEADLIQDNITPVAAYAPDARATSALLFGANEIPTVKFSDSTIVHVFALNGRTQFILTGVAAATPVAASGALTLADGVTPQQAFSIDDKLDDGLGRSGTVQAVTNLAGAISGNVGNTATDCIMTTTNAYNTAEPNAQGVNCRLMMRASF